MTTATTLDVLRDRLRPSARMPVVFLGHGSPMNALHETEYSRSWRDLGKALPRPQAILVVSAHWMTKGTTLVDVSALPRTIHDFRNFPQALYEMTYPAPGDPDLARDVVSLLASHHSAEDDSWGLDHGSWAVLKFLYPDADVPVFQISIDMSADLDHHIEIGRTLADLRKRGVLIMGSGNIVHNLPRMNPGGAPQDFAIEFDESFAARLEARDLSALADRAAMGSLLSEAHPTVDHYLPALTIAGSASMEDDLTFMTGAIDFGSVSMRSFVFHGA
jgi:4,5-DOPA dioxygenase extradiol